VNKRVGSAVVLGGSVVGLAAGLTFWYRFELSRHPPCPEIDVVRDLDLGRRELQTAVTTTIPVRNKGRQPLRISGVRTDCGCLAVLSGQEGKQDEKIDTLEIPPHGEAELRLRLGVGGQPGVPDRKQVVFATNDPRNPRVAITLRVTPFAEYVAAPNALVLGTVPTGAQIEREVEILVADRHVPAIRGVTCSTPLFRTSYRPVDFPTTPKPSTTAPEPCGRLTVYFDAPAQPGEVQGMISVFCAGREEPVVLISVSARVAPLVELFPAEILLPRASAAGAVYTVNCICRAATRKPLQLAVQDSPPPEVAVTIRDLPENAASKFLEIDAARLRDRIPAEGLVLPLSLTAEVDGRCIPLTLKLTLQRE
jgi:hypothetical protein